MIKEIGGNDVELKCPECGSDMKEFANTFKCRNKGNCTYVYTKKFGHDTKIIKYLSHLHGELIKKSIKEVNNHIKSVEYMDKANIVAVIMQDLGN